MADNEGSFRCMLTPLIRACGWEMDALKKEMGNCNALRESLAGESESIENALAQANGDLLGHNRPNSIIIVQQREISCRFIAHTNERLQEKRVEMDKAVSERAKIAGRLEKKRVELRGLELKRDTRKLAFENELRTKEQKECDDLWLVTARALRRG